MVRLWEASAVPPEVCCQRALVNDVHALFSKLLIREEVVAVLRTDPTLKEADREFALQVAQTHSVDVNKLNAAAWAVVKSRDAGTDASTVALRRAEAAVRLAPADGNSLNTLGVAQYRTGKLAEALGTLAQSEKLNTSKQGPNPADLAFLAMTQHQLGKKEEAQATLARLREVMKQPAWEKNAEAQGFLHEAEELIEGKATDKKD
jgi:Flp pilus assembly protein TadD